MRLLAGSASFFVQLPVLSKRAKPVGLAIRLQAQFTITVDA
jgi:hypothetical protein